MHHSVRHTALVISFNIASPSMYNPPRSPSLPHSHLSTEPQLLDSLLKRNLLINTLHWPTPLHDPPLVDGIHAARLPPATALANLLPPDALLLAEQVLVVAVARVQQVAPVGDAEAPQGIEVAVLVDDDVEVPGAAELAQPGVGRGLCAVRDCDEVDRRVPVCEGAELQEQFLGDWGARAWVSREVGLEGGRGATYMDTRNTA
jgi:hypothetical protein